MLIIAMGPTPSGAARPHHGGPGHAARSPAHNPAGCRLGNKLADAVTFTGGTDPVLPTPFRIGVAGAATLAATGLAAADLWELRTGRRQ